MSPAFTIIELLVVIAVIMILAGLLVPALGGARLAARVARAHSDLRQVTIALEMYHNRFSIFPPARTFCKAMTDRLPEYNHLPPELLSAGSIDSLVKDIFNPRQTYKYIAPGFGYANEAITSLAIRVPKEFPSDTGQELPYFNQRTSPVKCAVWSVGPSGAKSVFESDSLRYPMPPRHWYPANLNGIIVHYYWNGCWHSSP